MIVKRRKIHRASDERWIEYEIAHLLTAARYREKLTLKQVAKRLDMNFVTVWGWENNTAFPATLARLGIWCGALGFDVELTIKERGGAIVYTRKL